MKDKIAVVLPVRDAGTGRSARLMRCLESYKLFTEGLSDVYIIVDYDDIENYKVLFENIPEYVLHIHFADAGITLMQKINSISVDLAEKYKYVAFIGDDIIFRTSWESNFIEFLSNVDYGLAYANDFVHGENLATHPCITSNMIKAVGFFGCPALEHNYFDNYWMDIVREVGQLQYFPHTIMEHMHPTVGKDSHDHISNEISNKMMIDQQNFTNYMNDNKHLDIEKIRNFNNDL
jgi:hypothetical protein